MLNSQIKYKKNDKIRYTLEYNLIKMILDYFSHKHK